METKIIDKKNSPKLHEVFTFLHKAVNKDHPIMDYPTKGFYFDGNKIVTTDGKRLHIVEHDQDFDQCIFRVEKGGTKYIITEKIDGIFPNYQQIVETYNKSNDTFIGSFNSGNIDVSVSKILFLTKVCLNYTFVKDIFSKNTTWDFFCGEYREPVKFESSISDYKLTAYIMPIEVKRG